MSHTVSSIHYAVLQHTVCCIPNDNLIITSSIRLIEDVILKSMNLDFMGGTFSLTYDNATGNYHLMQEKFNKLFMIFLTVESL